MSTFRLKTGELVVGEAEPGVCPNCENGSGYTRRVGRDNDEIVEDCRNHRPIRCQGAGGTCLASPGWPHTDECHAEHEKVTA